MKLKKTRIYVAIVIVIVMMITPMAVFAATSWWPLRDRPSTPTNVAASIHKAELQVTWADKGDGDGVIIYIYGRDKMSNDTMIPVFSPAKQRSSNRVSVNVPAGMKVDYVTVVSYDERHRTDAWIAESEPSRPVMPKRR